MDLRINLRVCQHCEQHLHKGVGKVFHLRIERPCNVRGCLDSKPADLGFLDSGDAPDEDRTEGLHVALEASLEAVTHAADRVEGLLCCSGVLRCEHLEEEMHELVDHRHACCVGRHQNLGRHLPDAHLEGATIERLPFILGVQVVSVEDRHGKGVVEAIAQHRQHRGCHKRLRTLRVRGAQHRIESLISICAEVSLRGIGAVPCRHQALAQRHDRR
mmetsp:Transcript_71782/g.149926  ORF Transcript_71782/g.149926 Transcript_71782/m.149926 type:complete len:216 (-) Transcript_71782:1603-2250(-)